MNKSTVEPIKGRTPSDLSVEPMTRRNPKGESEVKPKMTRNP